MGITKKIDKYMGKGKKDANKAYEDRYDSIMDNIIKLKKRVEKHSVKQSKNPSDWGFAGDLSYIDEELTDLIKNFK